MSRKTFLTRGWSLKSSISCKRSDILPQTTSHYGSFFSLFPSVVVEERRSHGCCEPSAEASVGPDTHSFPACPTCSLLTPPPGALLPSSPPSSHSPTSPSSLQCSSSQHWHSGTSLPSGPIFHFLLLIQNFSESLKVFYSSLKFFVLLS